MATWIAAATGSGRLEPLVVVVETAETILLGMLTAATVAGVLGMLVPPVRMVQQTAADSTAGMIPGVLGAAPGAPRTWSLPLLAAVPFVPARRKTLFQPEAT